MAPRQWKEQKKEQVTSLGPQMAEGKMYLVSATPLCPSLTLRSNWSLWQGNHLLCDWRDESKGWWRWVLSICCHDVGCSGCARSWASLFSISNSGPQEEIGPWTRGPVISQGPCPLGMKIGQMEDVTYPLWQHLQEGGWGGGSCGCHLWTELLKLLFSINKWPLCQLKKEKIKKVMWHIFKVK